MVKSFHIRGGVDDTESGFQTRDLLRFFIIDVIIILFSKLLQGMGFFSTPAAYVLTVLSGKLVLFCYLAWLVHGRRNAWREAGGGTAGPWWTWPLCLGIYALSHPLLMWVNRFNIYLLQQIYTCFDRIFEPAQQNISFFIFEDILSLPIRVILVAFTILFGPFMEELAFRGMGLDAFRRTGGTASAVLWTSLLFGLYHVSLQMFVPLTALGAVFAMARLLSRSLWCALAIHSLHNSLVLAFTAHALGWFDFLTR